MIVVLSRDSDNKTIVQKKIASPNAEVGIVGSFEH